MNKISHGVARPKDVSVLSGVASIAMTDARRDWPLVLCIAMIMPSPHHNQADRSGVPDATDLRISLMAFNSLTNWICRTT